MNASQLHGPVAARAHRRWLPRPGPSGVGAEPDVTLFRIFLLDGGVFVSYGEFVRLDDNVIFSMPVGGPADQPRLQVAMVRTDLVDWPKTDRYASSARYQRYAETRGEEDYLRLSNEVADVLNTIALSTDRAAGARDRRACAADGRRLAAGTLRIPAERHPRDRVAPRSGDRVAAGRRRRKSLRVVARGDGQSPGARAGARDAERRRSRSIRRCVWRRSRPRRRSGWRSCTARWRSWPKPVRSCSAKPMPRPTAARSREAIRDELGVDKRYSDMSRRLLDQATRAAERADGTGDRARSSTRVATGGHASWGRSVRRSVEALNTSLQGKLADSRRLRLLRDQWALRRDTYRQYQQHGRIVLAPAGEVDRVAQSHPHARWPGSRSARRCSSLS